MGRSDGEQRKVQGSPFKVQGQSALRDGRIKARGIVST
jgi:hypothetical protein